ncbi:AtpZ/AtpI family protein [Temperatibacter marinus]|uniref:ATP synthase protein I n=1 Tax=Temperatibacter marinus TaxID=1456591 RepID=A0AA52EE41_9PROT|nr:AtpZ/AtpI family protein [Temperatibacter marinus]WND01993.1 AtpZ/AtpI family protein [Temperatibacter marinus]
MTDDEQIKSLEERLKKARNQGEPDVDEGGKPSPMGLAWKLGIELVIGVVVGLYLGSYIDDWLGTKPIVMILLVLLGFASGIRNVIKVASEMNKETDDQKQ